jgi:hypothetical protein
MWPTTVLFALVQLVKRIAVIDIAQQVPCMKQTERDLLSSIGYAVLYHTQSPHTIKTMNAIMNMLWYFASCYLYFNIMLVSMTWMADQSLLHHL